MSIVFLRAIILYFVIVFAMRLMGKRQLGELQPSELVVTILMSNIATLPVEDISIPMAMGIVPIFTLVCLDVFVSGICMRSRRCRRLFSGSPKIIISNGRIDCKVMKSLRFTADDLMEALRSVEVFDISQVQLAVVETTGKISVCLSQDYQPCTPKDLGIKAEVKNPPWLVVDNGEIIDTALKFTGIDRKKIDEILRRENCKLEQVFLMTCDSSGDYRIVKKNE